MQTCERDGFDSLHSSLVFSQEFSAWRAQHLWVVSFNQEGQNGNRQQGMSECPHDSRNTLKIQVMALKQSNPSGLIGKKNEQQYKKLDCTFKMQYVSVTVLLCEDPLHSSLVFSQEFSARRALVGRVVQWRRTEREQATGNAPLILWTKIGSKKAVSLCSRSIYPALWWGRGEVSIV